MKISPLVRAEFARLTSSRIGIASLVALMTVPLVYGGLYVVRFSATNELGTVELVSKPVRVIRAAPLPKRKKTPKPSE